MSIDQWRRAAPGCGDNKFWRGLICCPQGLDDWFRASRHLSSSAGERPHKMSDRRIVDRGRQLTTKDRRRLNSATRCDKLATSTRSDEEIQIQVVAKLIDMLKGKPSVVEMADNIGARIRTRTMDLPNSSMHVAFANENK
jgi:hypothetical protein